MKKFGEDGEGGNDRYWFMKLQGKEFFKER